MIDKFLLLLAREARKEMENFAKDHQNIGDHIGDPKDLNCQCAISSYFLKLLGKRFGYNLTLVQGVAFERPYSHTDNDINHCWIEYKDHIIDLTATQFNKKLKKVHVVNKKNENYLPLRKSCSKDSFKDWPEDQSPFEFKEELILRVRLLSLLRLRMFNSTNAKSY